MDTDVTITEAASIKGVSRSAVHLAITQGRLPAHTETVGAARIIWKIKREDLATWEPATPEEKGKRGGRPRKRDI